MTNKNWPASDGAEAGRERETRSSKFQNRNTPRILPQDWNWQETIPVQLALELARAGLPVLPATVQLTSDYATTEEKLVRTYWRRFPDAPVAVNLPGLGLYVPDPYTEGQLLPHQVKHELEDACAKLGYIVWGSNPEGGYSEPSILYVAMSLQPVEIDCEIARTRRKGGTR